MNASACSGMASGGASVAKDSSEEDTKQDAEEETIMKFCAQLDDYTPTVRMN